MANRFPKVSVIVSTFNNMSFIRNSLESLLRQEYPKDRMEIIVVDDGSTDGTGDILKEYAEKVTYIYQDNRGIASVRNMGMSIAKGEIITFLDSDDEWREDRIQKVVEKFIDMPNIGIVYHPVELINERGQVIHKNFYKAFGYKEGLSGWIANDIIRGRIFCGGSSFAYRKKIIDKAFPIPENIKRGVDFYYTVISSCYAKAEYIPDLLGRYRLHSGNITMARGEDDFRELAIVNKDFAHMREVIIDKLQTIDSLRNKFIDIGILKRILAKEEIFYEVLSDRRGEAIKKIPLLFYGKPTYNEILKAGIVSFMALCIPSPLFPLMVKTHGFLKRWKII